MSTPIAITPIYIKGEVIKGFQRGSTLLGFPTANLPADRFEKEISDLKTGVYFGWCSLRGVAYKTVMSIGYNPTFGNVSKTIVIKFQSFYSRNPT
jgi:FAD synthase